MMRSLVLAIALTALGACDSIRAPADPRVEIGGEVLVGKHMPDHGVSAFLGVPFAEPPVGDLRWRVPQPLQTKVARRDVSRFAPACMQSMRILDWYRYMAGTFGGSGDYYADLDVSEDCLYLNIWTPTLESDAKLPVMVWVHGGSNRSGWSYEPNYHGHVLAQEGVVVVSVAYRQGAFGFLSPPGLTADEPTANFGLWDIVASLQWIQDNIEQFGGDPHRVTAFGESAGAEDILALMFAKPAAGLFHRAILESTAGYGIDGSSLDGERERGRKLASILGIEGDNSLAQLRQVPADKLLRVYEEAFLDYYHAPAIDGQLITEATWESIQAGRFGDHQLIIGANADESSDRLTTANDYLCPSQNTAARMTAAGRSAWMYFFTRVRKGAAGEKLGAYHGAELPYVFGTHDAYMPTTDIDQALTETMIRYWTRFAATGDPNSERRPDWPRFAAPEFPVQELGDEVLTTAAPESELCKLFAEGTVSRD